MPLMLPMTMNALDAALPGRGAWLPGASAVVPPPGATFSPTTPLMLFTSPSIGATSVVLLRFCCAVCSAACALATWALADAIWLGFVSVCVRSWSWAPVSDAAAWLTLRCPADRSADCLAVSALSLV